MAAIVTTAPTKTSVFPGHIGILFHQDVRGDIASSIFCLAV